MQHSERTDARLEGRARIDGVELVQVDAVDAEGLAAGVASGTQGFRTRLVHPFPARPSQPAFRRDFDRRPVARPGLEGLGDQPFVVTEIALVVAVRVGGIEQRRARVERRVDDGDAARVIAVQGGRQAHAPEADRAFHVSVRSGTRKFSTQSEPAPDAAVNTWGVRW